MWNSPPRLIPYQSWPHSLWTCLSWMSPTLVGAALTVLIPGTPQSPHHSTVMRISSGFGWTGRGAGRFLPLWLGAGPSLWYQFRHVLIALCRVVFTPNLYLLGVNMGPLVALITEFATGRAVLLSLLGTSNESSKWAPKQGSPNKGDIQ